MRTTPDSPPSPSERDVSPPSYSEDLASTILLGAAALVSGYSVWQSGLWGGVQSTMYNAAGIEVGDSARRSTLAAAELNYDAITTVQLVIAYAEDPERGREMVERVIRPEFKPYVESWLAERPFVNANAPSSPFAMPGFHNAKLVAANAHYDAALAKFEQGSRANTIGDAYLLTTVTAGFVMFFASVGLKLRRPRFRLVLIGGAIAALMVTLFLLARLPQAGP